MNFSLPAEIIIQGFHLPTIYIFLFIGVLSWFFSMWFEGRRDGFDEERLLDLSFLTFLLGTLLYTVVDKYTNWLAIYRPYNFLLKFDKSLLLPFVSFFGGGVLVTYLCKFWSWSKYRLLDIYVSALSQLGFLVAFGAYLIYKTQALIPLLVLLPLIYILILRLRSLQFISGLTFSIFLILMIPYITMFYRKPGYLFFCAFLATISLLNFYLRWRKNYAGTTSFGRVYKTVRRKINKKTTRTRERAGSSKK